MPKSKYNGSVEHSKFFQACGFKPKKTAYKIDSALERKMESLRYIQRSKGLCACVVYRSRNMHRVQLCSYKPHTDIGDRQDPFGYCKVHLRYRRIHSRKYLGYNAVKSWRRLLTAAGIIQSKIKFLGLEERLSYQNNEIVLALLELQEFRL